MKRTLSLLAAVVLGGGLLGCAGLNRGVEKKPDATPTPVAVSTPTPNQPTPTPEPATPAPTPLPQDPVKLLTFTFPDGLTIKRLDDAVTYDGGMDDIANGMYGPGHCARFEVYPPEGPSAYIMYVSVGRWETGDRMTAWPMRKLRDDLFWFEVDVSGLDDDAEATAKFGARTITGTGEWEVFDGYGSYNTYPCLWVIEEDTFYFFEVLVRSTAYDKAQPYIDAMIASLKFDTGVLDEVYGVYAD